MKIERIWGVAMTVTAAVLVAGILAVPAFMTETGVEFMAENIMDHKVKDVLDKQYVANQYLEQQVYDTQVYRYNQELRRLEAEMVRPGTTIEQKSLYTNQKNDILRQKSDEQKRFNSRSQ